MGLSDFLEWSLWHYCYCYFIRFLRGSWHDIVSSVLNGLYRPCRNLVTNLNPIRGYVDHTQTHPLAMAVLEWCFAISLNWRIHHSYFSWIQICIFFHLKSVRRLRWRQSYDDAITWKHFSYNWPFAWETTCYQWIFYIWKPPVTGGFPTQRASDVFFWCQTE